MNNIYIHIFVMALTVFIIRTLPLTLIRKPITNRFIRDFLYYVPYVTLSLMTFPSMIDATNNIYAGIISFIIGSFFAYKEYGLFKVTLICCITVAILEILI